MSTKNEMAMPRRRAAPGCAECNPIPTRLCCTGCSAFVNAFLAPTRLCRVST